MANPASDIPAKDVPAPGRRCRRALALLVPALGFALALALARPVGAADAIPGERWCGVADGDGIVRDVDRIEFVGNRVTRAEVLARELHQAVGAPCSLDAVIDGIQGLADLDLFRSVRAELRLESAGTPDRDSLVLRYVVREKIYFFAVPRVSRTSDGEVRTGLQLRWDNFSGRLHELRITAESRREDEGRGRKGYVRSLSYRVPRFLGSAWGASLALAVERSQVELAQESRLFGEGEREAARVDLALSRWLGDADGVSGWRAHAGIGLERRELEVLSGGRGPYLDGFDASVVVGLSHDALHRESFRRRGHEAEASLRIGAPWTGSDFSYHRMDLRAARYVPLAGGIRNLNVQVRVGLSDGGAFGEAPYAIGGGELLRGVAPGRDVGELLAVVNVEYLTAFFTRPQWRRVLFVDVGNVHPKGHFRPLAQNVRAGLGLRYKLRAITRTDLRLDVAWDVDEGRAVPYVATSVTF